MRYFCSLEAERGLHDVKQRQRSARFKTNWSHRGYLITGISSVPNAIWSMRPSLLLPLLLTDFLGKDLMYLLLSLWKCTVARSKSLILLLLLHALGPKILLSSILHLFLVIIYSICAVRSDDVIKIHFCGFHAAVYSYYRDEISRRDSVHTSLSANERLMRSRQESVNAHCVIPIYPPDINPARL